MFHDFGMFCIHALFQFKQLIIKLLQRNGGCICLCFS